MSNSGCSQSAGKGSDRSIVVEGLSFTYPGAEAATLSDINFHVDTGESLALLGSSGAGKTTLLNVLSGLLPAQDGKITFSGRDVTSLPASQRGVAQVFQFPVLYETLSVRENIAFALRTRGTPRKQRWRRADELAELFDLQALLDRKPTELSLFEKQLTGVAKSLVREDLSMVLLDEPLTAVEPAMKWRLRGAVKRAQAQVGVPMVYVTHDQTEALTFADRVSVLHDGRLLQTGTPAGIYAQPEHAEVARFIGNPGMNVVPGEIAAGRLSLGGVLLDVPAVGSLTTAIAELGDGEVEFGFRPEWSSLVSAAGQTNDSERQESTPGGWQLPAVLQAVRLTGATAFVTQGIAELVIGEQRVQVACEQLEQQTARHAQFSVHRCLLFRAGERVAELNL